MSGQSIFRETDELINDRYVRNLALQQAVAANRSQSAPHTIRMASEFENYLKLGYQEPPKKNRTGVWLPIGMGQPIRVGFADVYPSQEGLKVIFDVTLQNYERLDSERIYAPSFIIEHSENEENN